MTFSSDERSLLAALADVLIPAGDGFPAASGAGIASDGLDQLLGYRPDLGPGLKRLLAAADGQPAAVFVAGLKASNPDGFGLLAELVSGAYFLNPEVRAKLNYHGQGPRPIDPRPDYLDDGLLQSVLDRGPIYRPTPH
ncbi:MAG TPA: hypothetical protein VFT34_16570 [Verrucomicrobiae bacterium]|nr:hypothetical protein [Verrucomicrobiae bacterium]